MEGSTVDTAMAWTRTRAPESKSRSIMIIPFGGTILKLETSIYDVGVRNDAGGESPRANTVVDRGVLDRPLLTWQARRSSDAKGAWG